MTNKQERMTTSMILERTMQRIAPLPSQEGYARALATIFSMHIHRNVLIDEGFSVDELPAPSAIVVAPTGQGKTYLVRKMAEALGLNTITIDCGTLSAEGWKGISLSQRLAAAVEDAKDEKAFAQSILFLDEVDKLHLWGTHNDQGNAMTSILQLFNGGTVAVEISTKSGRKTENIDISRFTILLGGAFEGLDEIIRERTSKARIGFGSDVGEKKSKAELIQQVASEDLVKFGLMPELLGRIGTILVIPPLGLEDYRQLLNAKNGSLRRKYSNYLQGLYGVSVEFTGAGVDAIALKCMDTTTGARAVNPLVNDLMRDAIVAVEDDDTLCKVILDAGEEGCRIYYEHGPRQYSFHDPAREVILTELPRHIVKANNLPALTRKLIRYYKNGGGDLTGVPELEAFLDCAITYLGNCCRPADFEFCSLEKFARATRRGSVCSPFEIILKDATKIVTIEKINRYKELYSLWTPQRLVNALQAIMVYLQERHGKCRVIFCVKNKRL